MLVESADPTGELVDGVLGVSDRFAISSTTDVGEGGPRRPVLALRGAVPNPAPRGTMPVEFTLRDGTPARLELIDVTGRVRTLRQVGALGPGVHTLDLSTAGALPPGVYFLRLTQGASQVRARAAVIR